jgi:hypothetical protein
VRFNQREWGQLPRKGDLTAIKIMSRAPAYFVALLIILTIDQFTMQGASSSAQYTRIHAIITEPVEKTALGVFVKALKERRGVPVYGHCR